MSLDNLSPEELEKLKSLLSEPSEKAQPTEKPQKARTAPKEKGKPWYRNRVIMSAVALVALLALASAYVFVIDPAIKMRDAENALNDKIKREAIVAINTEILPYETNSDDVILPGANPKQIALGENSVITSPAYFEFGSKNSTDSSTIVDVYLDFYSQRSRDFISLNQDTLKSFIGSGKIILRVHPVLQKDGFSIFAPEALAEVFATHPDLAWSFFTSLMKNSDALLNQQSTETNTEITNPAIVAFIAKISAEVGIKTGSPDGVDAESIKYLSFFSWMYSNKDDPRLAVGYYPPVLYIDDELIDQDEWPLSDPDKVLELLSQKS